MGEKSSRFRNSRSQGCLRDREPVLQKAKALCLGNLVLFDVTIPLMSKLGPLMTKLPLPGINDYTLELGRAQVLQQPLLLFPKWNLSRSSFPDQAKNEP